ncbi:MAG: hypothetical protein ABFS39_15460 [Pseudomonadota bacterium]
MANFSCKSMRTAIIVAGGLLSLAILLLSPVILLPKPLPYVVTLFVYPGFAALILSPVILIATALTSLVPSVNAQLQNCQH